MSGSLVPKVPATVPSNEETVSAAPSVEDQILELDCVELSTRIRDGSLRAEKVCAKFLQQYDRHRSLNLVTWMDQSDVLSRANYVDRTRDEGYALPALAGLPILVKDNIDTVGLPTSAGTPSLKHNFPLHNAPVVARLLQQGAILMGKSNMHELGAGITSSNSTFGFVRNPYDPDLIAGGSSGGSAAAIAARVVPAALGTDTGGSVRIPAAFCGVVGFRPSIYPRKLYSQQGVVPLSFELDTIGPMGRTVADVALLHATIVGELPPSPRSLEKMRIGIPRHAYWENLDPEIERVSETALKRLREHGAVFVEIDLREIREAAVKLFSILASGVIGDMESFLRTLTPQLSLRELTEQIACYDVRAEIELARAAGPDPDLFDARGTRRDQLRAAYVAAFQRNGIDAIVFPTVVLPPPQIRAAGDHPNDMIEFNGCSVSKQLTILRNSEPTVAFGAPGLSLPIGLTNGGLPVGLELDGLPGNDNSLLALGMAAETAIGRLPGPPQSRSSVSI